MDLQENGQRLSAYQNREDDLLFLAELNDQLQLLNKTIAQHLPPSSHPIVVIGGVQRSGTTLLYQMMVRYLRVSYINNLVARFYGAPLVGMRLSQTLGCDEMSRMTLTSDYGVTPGAEGPHEFGYFWTQWLRLDKAATHLLTDEEAAAIDWPGLASCLRGLTALSGIPLVLKNPIAVFNSHHLFPFLPELRLLLIQRDPFFQIQSVYQARKKRYGDPLHWWSLKPPTYPQLRDDPSPLRQVVGQVLDSLSVFAHMQRNYPERCCAIQYQNLRTQPAESIGILAHQLGLQIREGFSFPGPAELPDGDQVRVTSEEERQIRQAIDDWHYQKARAA